MPLSPLDPLSPQKNTGERGIFVNFCAAMAVRRHRSTKVEKNPLWNGSTTGQQILYYSPPLTNL
jgi:hypothetical protein